MRNGRDAIYRVRLRNDNARVVETDRICDCIVTESPEGRHLCTFAPSGLVEIASCKNLLVCPTQSPLSSQCNSKSGTLREIYSGGDCLENYSHEDSRTRRGRGACLQLEDEALLQGGNAVDLEPPWVVI